MKKMKKIMQFCLALILGLTLAVVPVLASQNNMVVPDGTGLAVRTNINNALNTLVTLNSGPSEPSTKYAYMLWADTTAAKLKIRNAANDAWIIIGDLPSDRLGLAQVSSLQYASYISGASTTGNDSYAITLSPVPTALVNGMQVILLPDVSNTGSASLNLNSLGAKTIKKGQSGALITLSDNDILANTSAALVYSSTNNAWLLLNPNNDIPDISAGLQSVQVFTTSGTWTKPTGIKRVRVLVLAGGGGGGGSNYNSESGAGGGAGGRSEKLIDVSAINSETVTVGVGGTGGTPSTIGGPGGPSSFGSHCSATGGGGGEQSGIPGAGGTGGAGSSGDINSTGAPGENQGMYGYGFIGGGASSPYGGGGKGRITAGTGNAGTGYGSGGGGGMNTGSAYGGGAGAPGIVIVWEYK